MSLDLLSYSSQKYSQSLFLKDDRGELSYARAEVEVSQLATSLHHFLGNIFKQSQQLKQVSLHPTVNSVKPVIALLLPPGIDYCLMVLACYRLRKLVRLEGTDIRILPLNPHKPESVLREEMERAEVDILINNFPHIIPTTNYPTCSLTELKKNKVIEFKWGDGGSLNNYPEVDNDPFIYLFTSGSSGESKIAVFSWDNWMMSAESGDSFFPFRQGDSWLHLLPFYHVSGMSILFRALLYGGAVVFTDNPLATHEDWLNIISSYAITHLSVVPAQITRVNGGGIQSMLKTLKLLKMVLMGGGPIPESLIPHLYPHTPLRPTYGLTESVAHVAIYDGPHFDDNRLFVKILPSRRVKIGAGEIFIHHDSLFLGYLKEKKIIQPWNEWFATGDMGELRGDYLTVRGRKDRQFISGGENIYPEEIERIILAYPGAPKITGVVVFPIPHERWGMVPAAVVGLNRELLPDPSLGSLINYLKGSLETHKVPRQFYYLPESLNNLGIKLSYQKVEEVYHKGELEKII